MSDKIIKSSLDIDDWFTSLNEDIDIWITDPPYPFDNQNGTNRFKYEDGTDNMYQRLSWSKLSSIFSEMHSRSSEGARAYIFCNRDGLFETQPLLKNAGWTFRNVLVWDKKRLGMGYHWRNKVEYILYVTKGKPKSYVKGSGNIFSYNKPKGKGVSAKPHDIWVDILEHSAVSGDICADPFAGSNPMEQALLSYPSLYGKIGSAYTNSV
tara:strand:- start:144 stop:770 length:627 start_codon:yes stop_codon:yes gene_type:complete